jgi:acylphosphatase
MEARMGAGEVRTVRVRIAGRVQGVSYRYWAERNADELGLSGWVRNRRDGTVEAVFSGALEDVAEMIERCREGPRSAQVASVDVVEEPAAPPPGFQVLPTA